MRPVRLLLARLVSAVVVAVVACALAGCPAASESTFGENDGVSEPGASAPGAMCTQDAECATAAATCCECPAFAVESEDPAARACTGVTCPDQAACPANVRAACEQGACVLACVELACPATCAAGFTLDPTGCRSCACAEPAPEGCTVDADCVQTRADCCGCAHGGADTAVLGTAREGFDAALGCSPSPQCPAIDVCEAAAAPRCIQGRCELSSAGLPPGACGRADLPACPAGEVCVVNRSDAADSYGVGVCAPG